MIVATCIAIDMHVAGQAIPKNRYCSCMWKDVESDWRRSRVETLNWLYALIPERSLASQTLSGEERVWSNSLMALVWVKGKS